MPCQDGQFIEPSGIWASSLTPGITWDSWRDLLHQEWSSIDRARSGWSDTEAMARAATSAPLDTPFEPREYWHSDDTRPWSKPTADQAAAYASASGLFHAGRFAEAIAAFDAIASSQAGNAARAAYSAARAALDSGAFEDGIARVGKIIADPAMREMHQAAHHLVGTITYDTGASPLLAARLTDITHLVMAPHEFRCRDSELRILMREADDDLDYILRGAFPADHFDDFPPWSRHTRQVLAHLAHASYIVDLIQVLAAPTPFNRNGPWIEPFYPDALPHPGVPLYEQATVSGADEDGPALTDHARDRARQTGNPLWAYALAIRTTNPADLPILQGAEQAARNAAIPSSERVALSAWLATHEARILLMAGREDDALAVAGRVTRSAQYGLASPGDLMADGGTRFLLAKRDLDGARRWAAATHPREAWGRPASQFVVALARTWDEALAAAAPNDMTYDSAFASGLDLLSADHLAALSRKPGLSAPLRRRILSAAWIRYYMLEQDVAFRALFPDVRAVFPEIAADLDDIGRTWMPWTRRHRITRMLLKLPGLSPRPLWVRPALAASYRYTDQGQSLFSINSFDPSDGNWWCAVDPARAQRDVFGQLFALPLSSYFSVNPDTVASLVATGSPEPSQDAVDALMHDWIAWHPLFKDADLAELARLSQVSSGPVRLGRDAIAWAHGSSWLTRWVGLDDGLAETLALAVRATRYGCRRDGALGTVSRAAWSDLHRLFPTSEAAARTPYWFDEHAAR